MKKDIRVYSESGWICEVEILEDMSDDVSERYKLKVLKTLSTHPCFEALPPKGSVFICSKKIGRLKEWTLTNTSEVKRET
jgi:hypothetical protein